MDWVDAQLHDDAVFPSQVDVPFPRNFEGVVKDIMRRLFRIYAHCYYHHLDKLNELDVSAHLNTSFKHFVFFTHEFKMIPPDQLEPLQDIINSILQA
jgi:MOB kinase activator 1